MSDFIEDPPFPDYISRGAIGGPGYRTNITEMRSGHEVRNPQWDYPRHGYDAATGISDIEDVEDVIALFHAAEGSALGFRYPDYGDYKSCRVKETISMLDQTLVADLVQDPTGLTYPLIKTYTWGTKTKTREITKPQSGVLIADNGVLQQEFTHYNIDLTNGVIVFLSAPTGPVTAGFHFHVPVRFQDDELAVRLEWAELGSVPIVLLEDKIRRYG